MSKEQPAAAANMAKSRAKKREDIASVLLRKETALADLRELEKREKEGSLVPKDAAAAVISRTCQAVRDAFLSAGEKRAQEWAAITDARQILQQYNALVTEILTKTVPDALRESTKLAA